MQGVITPIFLLLAAIIGLLIGLLVSNLTSSREKKQSPDDEAQLALQKEGFAEALRLWYSPGGKKIITELDGEFYRDFLLLSTEQRNRVLKLLSLWSLWAGEVPESRPQSLPEKEIDQVNHVQAVPASLEPSVAEVIQREEEPAERNDKPASIAGQVSLIIDQLLEDSPLKDKGIKLIENQNQGVDVWVGTEKFEGIDAIPYPEVQQLIRKAVLLWEKKTEEGRSAI